MNKLFISYSYVGQQGGQIYQGFGNCFLPLPQEPKNEELLEAYTEMTNKKAIEDTGMETITCTILFFKQTSI
jgi:hypothetical protein